MRKLLAGLLFILGCGNATAPVQIANAVPFAEQYLLVALWRGLDECTGQTLDLSQVQFYTVPDEWITVDGGQYWGYWFREGNRVFLTSRVATSGVAIEHEMMHARLQRSDHPQEFFNGMCGNLLNPVAGQG